MPKIDQLTTARVKALKAPGDYLDGRGLYLQIRSATSKSWLLKYSITKRAREMGLGSAFDFTLAEARDMRDRYRKLAKTGIDPIDHRKAEAAARAAANAKVITFRQAAERFIVANRSEWKNTKHAKQWTATFETYVFPIIGDLPIQSVDTPLVSKILEPIWSTLPETARRVRGRIEQVIAAAKARGEFMGDNPATWKGHLESVLPRRAKTGKGKKKRQPALPHAQLPAFMAALAEREGIASDCLTFQILTAVRPGNACEAKWSEIDLQKATWSIADDDMKTNEPHIVPLNAAALAVLARMEKIRSGEFVFFGAQSKRPLSDGAVLALIKRMHKAQPWTDPRQSNARIVSHGFRSTFRDWAAERGYQDAVAEAALAHTVSDGVIAAYKRTTFVELRKQLMDDWATYAISDPSRSADVIKLTAHAVSI